MNKRNPGMETTSFTVHRSPFSLRNKIKIYIRLENGSKLGMLMNFQEKFSIFYKLHKKTRLKDGQ